jgi:hypothetical protein
MPTLQGLIDAEKNAAMALVAAKAAHQVALLALTGPLDVRHHGYCDLFEPLGVTAKALGQSLPELHGKGIPPANARWGNRGVTGLRHDSDGFTQITTADVVRGDTDVFVSYIPTKYLAENGAAVMHEDAIRIQVDLARQAEEAQLKKDTESARQTLAVLERLRPKRSPS